MELRLLNAALGYIEKKKKIYPKSHVFKNAA